MSKLFKNKKGSAFIETLLFTPITIFLVLMVVSRVIVLTQTTANEDLARIVLRDSISCDMSSETDNDNSLLSILNSYETKAMYVSEIRIVNPAQNTVLEKTDFSKNKKMSELTDDDLDLLNEHWKKGNIIEIEFFFTMIEGLANNVMEVEIGVINLNPIPNGSYVTVKGVIENDKIN